MKKRKEEFSNSITKYSSVNASKDNLKEKKYRTRFEFLYENSSIHDKKLDLIRAKSYFKIKERTIPVINPKSKNLKRPQGLFYKRLYKSDNDLSIELSKSKSYNQEKNKLKSENVKKLSKDGKIDKKCNNISHESQDSKGEKKINDEDSLYISDNKIKNNEYKKYYKNSNIKSRNATFLFKPKINNKSKLIANRMKTTSTERLFELSSKEKENLKTLFQKRKMEKEKKLNLKKERKLHRLFNYTYKPNVKNTKSKWADKLYERGINFIKKREEEIKNEKLLNEKEYLQYSFTPMINHNYSYSFLNGTNDIINNQFNIKKHPNILYKNNYFNRTNISCSKMNNTSFYERSINWKKLLEKKKEEMRKKLSNNTSITLDEKTLNKQSNSEIMATDVSFIRNNFIEYETFLDRYNYQIIKRNLDKINYRKINVPPKQIYAKKLVIEYVSECDSNCSTNAGTVKYYCNKRPINEIYKNRDELKINDFFQDDFKLDTKNFLNYDNKYVHNTTRIKTIKTYRKVPKQKIKNYTNNLSFFNAVNNLINKIE